MNVNKKAKNKHRFHVYYLSFAFAKYKNTQCPAEADGNLWKVKDHQNTSSQEGDEHLNQVSWQSGTKIFLSKPHADLMVAAEEHQ